MMASGFGLAFYRGWSLALALFGIAPIIGIGMGVFTALLSSKSKA